MEIKENNKRNFLNYLLTALILICISLLLIEIGSNVLAELNTNQSKEGFSVTLEYDHSGQKIQFTPTPKPTRDPSLPTPTFDITHGE